MSKPYRPYGWEETRQAEAEAELTEVVTEEPQTIGWHLHRWSKWSDVSDSRGGLIGAFGGTDAMKGWQQQNCVRCNLTVRRLVGWHE